MALPQDWRQLAAQFNDIAERCGLDADARFLAYWAKHQDGAPSGIVRGWSVWAPLSAPRDEFCQLASVAAAMLGHSVNGDRWAWTLWLSSLHRDPVMAPYVRPISFEIEPIGNAIEVAEAGGSEIQNVCRVSALYCQALAVGVATKVRTKRASRFNGDRFPNRAKWLDQIMNEHGLKPHHFPDWSGPSAKSIKRIKGGQPVMDDVLVKLVRALNHKIAGGRFAFEHIPRD